MFLFGFVAKEEISSKYLDLLIAELILCLSLLGIFSKLLEDLITSLKIFCAFLIAPSENSCSAFSISLNKCLLVSTIFLYEVYNYT